MSKPKRLEKTPMVDSICEIRFDPSLPSDIVPGAMTSALTSLNISEIQRLPILDIPESARNIDPNLLHAPYYKAKIGDITFQFGARMVALSSPMPYIGWDVFQVEIRKILEKILEANIVIQVNRVAIRTVNFFEVDVLEKSKFEVNTPISYDRSHYSYTDFYKDNELVIRTTIANNASIRETSDSTERKGSIIDIDAYIEQQVQADIDVILENIEKSHSGGKEVFFSLLKDEFIETLEPVNE